MSELTKANTRVKVYETHNHLAGKADGARMSWRSYLVNEAEGRESGCSHSLGHHSLGHRSREAAKACGSRRYRALPDDVEPNEATAGGLPR